MMLKKEFKNNHLLILKICLIFPLSFYSQIKKIKWKDKEYKVYVNFPPSNVPTDSIEGLLLIGNNFNDFPEEVFIYKNLQYLEIDSYSWGEVLDSLSEAERQEYDSLRSNSPNGFLIKRYYKPNCIQHIPKKIKTLKRLEVVDLSGTIIRNKKKFMKIYKYLPSVDIIPDKSIMELD